MNIITLHNDIMIHWKKKNCLLPHTTQDVVGDFIDGRIQRGAKVIKKCRHRVEQNADAPKWLGGAVLGAVNEKTYDERRVAESIKKIEMLFTKYL